MSRSSPDRSALCVPSSPQTQLHLTAPPDTPTTTTGLDYSIEHFRALGIDTPDKFAAFSLPDYDLVGVTDAGDRKRLFFLVQRVKVVRSMFFVSMRFWFA